MQHDLEHDPALARRLSGLPEDPQPYGFAEFQRRSRPPQAGERPSRAPHRFFSAGALGLLMGAAAGIVIAVLGVSWGLHEGVIDPIEAELTARSSAPAPPPLHTPAAADRQRQVEAMEGWLASLPEDRAMVRVGSRAAMAGLEDRIAQLDDQISVERAASAHPARLQAIEHQRSQLLRSLVQVRYAETLAAGR